MNTTSTLNHTDLLAVVNKKNTSTSYLSPAERLVFVEVRAAYLLGSRTFLLSRSEEWLKSVVVMRCLQAACQSAGQASCAEWPNIGVTDVWTSFGRPTVRICCEILFAWTPFPIAFDRDDLTKTNEHIVAGSEQLLVDSAGTAHPEDFVANTDSMVPQSISPHVDRTNFFYLQHVDIYFQLGFREVYTLEIYNSLAYILPIYTTARRL